MHDNWQQPKRKYLGVTLLTLTPQLITELQMRGTELPANENNGVLIWKVVVGSPAHQYAFILLFFASQHNCKSFSILVVDCNLVI